MKIVVYTIAKNEERFVRRWFDSCKDADYILIGDTGSTDGTVDAARVLGISVVRSVVVPWRFDAARNNTLAHLPGDADLCIALDMDEVLQPGWREKLEALPAGTTRPRYKYVWSWTPDGTPGIVYSGDKVHARHGYRWKHPVHETLVHTGDGYEQQVECGIEIHHHPDPSKPRSQYLPLLELATREGPDDDRIAFYYARELFFHGRRVEAAIEFKRHLSLPSAVWRPERARAMRYLAEIEDHERETWLLRACGESPDRREPWVDLAKYYYTLHDWPACYASAVRALTITDPPLEYLCEPEAWGHAAHDFGAIAAHWMGLKDTAIMLGIKALQAAPNDRRLRDNLHFYMGALTNTYTTVSPGRDPSRTPPCEPTSPSARSSSLTPSRPTCSVPETRTGG